MGGQREERYRRGTGCYVLVVQVSGVIGSPVGCQFGGARTQEVVGDHDEPVPDSAAVDAPGSR